MIEISTFGCSWTRGVPPDFNNWSRQLSVLDPNFNVNDYSMGGTSVRWSVSQLLRQQRKGNKAIKIFQITAPNRITIPADDDVYDLLRYRVNEQFEFYEGSLFHYILPLNPNFVYGHHEYYTPLQVKSTYQVLYENIDTHAELHEYKLYIDWLKENVDFMFFHREDDLKSYIEAGGSSLPCVETYFGSAQFNDWVYDNGAHFNLEGSTAVARWIKEQLKL